MKGITRALETANLKAVAGAYLFGWRFVKLDKRRLT